MILPTTVPILQIQNECRHVRTFVLDMELESAEPGQFVMLWLPGVDEKPMSIACPAPLTITVTRVGPFSTALHEMQKGERVGIRGPYGRGFAPDGERPALLVAGGCGSAPLYFLATQTVAAGIPTVVAVGAQRASDLIYVDRFRDMDVELVLATDDGSLGHKGYVSDAILPMISGDWQPTLYACGPELMLAALLRLCTEHQLRGQFSVERYMKCGFGICGQCALDGLLVCQDGPVLTAEQLENAQEFGQFRRSATGRQLPIR